MEEELQYDDFFTTSIGKNKGDLPTIPSTKVFGYNTPLGKSKYDKNLRPDVHLDMDDNFFSTLTQYRSYEQPTSHKLGNATMRITNVIPGIIGNFASIEDLGDQFTTDFKAGNVITEWANKWKESTNESFPIYRENPGKTLDLGDPAYWIEQGSGLANSAIEFGISGGILLKGLTRLSKIVKLRQLSNAVAKAPGIAKLGLDGAQIGRGAQILQHATIMNGMEGTLTAADTFDSVYQTQLADYLGQGLSNEEAHTKATTDAAEGAAATYNANKWAIPLNLISSGMFMKKLPTRGGGTKPGWKADTKTYLGEGVQEYGEETINFLAGNYGEAKGTKKKYGFNEIIKDLGTPEAFESGILGFLGGVGQTAFTKQAVNRINKTIDPETGEKISIRNYNKKVYNDYKDFIDKLEAVQKDGNISTFTNSFETLTDQIKLKKAYEEAVEKGNVEEAKRIAALSVDVQAYDAFTKGATDVLIKTYESIRDGEQKEGLPDNYKEKATEAIKKIETLEKFYNESSKYKNPKEVYINRSMNYDLINQVKDLNNDIADITSSLQEQVDILTEDTSFDPNIVDGTSFNININNLDFNPAKEANTGNKKAIKEFDELVKTIKTLPDYEALNTLKDLKTKVKGDLKDNIDKYSKITSEEYQKDFEKRLKNAKNNALNKLDKQVDDVQKDIKNDEKLAKEAEIENIKSTVNDEINNNVDENNSLIREFNNTLEGLSNHYNKGETLNLEFLGDKYKDKLGTIIELTENEDGTVDIIIETEDGEKITKLDTLSPRYKNNDISPVTNTEGSVNKVTSNSDSIDSSLSSDNKNDNSKNKNKLSDVKLMSTYKDSGKILPGILKEFVEYERNGANKVGTKVNFEINRELTSNKSQIDEINKRREEELDKKVKNASNNIIREEREKENLEENQEVIFTIGQKYNEGHNVTLGQIVDKRSEEAQNDSNHEPYKIYIGTHTGAGGKPTILTDGVVTQSGKHDIAWFDSKEDADTWVKEQKAIAKNIKEGKDPRQKKRADKINAKYDAEIAKLKSVSSNKSSKFNQALSIYNKIKKGEEVSKEDKNLLVDYLPIKLKINNSNELYTFLMSKPSGDVSNDAKEAYNNRSRPLRISLIKALLDGNDINNLYSTIKGQYGGQLNMDDIKVNNNPLELQYIDNDLSKVELFVINDEGQLIDTKGNYAKGWTKTKENWKGATYLKIKKANGDDFYLNLNFGKVNKNQANSIFDIYKIALGKDIRPNTLLTQLPDDVQKSINKNLKTEIDLLKKVGNKSNSDITISELLDLIFWDGSDLDKNKKPNIKSKLRINYNNQLIEFGDKSYRQNEFNEDKREEFVNWVTTNKNRNFKFKAKRSDKIQSLNSTNPEYVKYIFNQGVLSTNTKINEPSFIGFTNLYINNAIAGISKVKETITEIKDNIPFNEDVDGKDFSIVNFGNMRYYASPKSGRLFESKVNKKTLNEEINLNLNDKIGKLITDISKIERAEKLVRQNFFDKNKDIILKRYQKSDENILKSQEKVVTLQENEISDESTKKQVVPTNRSRNKRKSRKDRINDAKKRGDNNLNSKCKK